MWVNSHSRTGLRHCNFQLQIFRCVLQSDGLCKLHVGKTEPEEMALAANAIHSCFFFFSFHSKSNWCFLQRNHDLMGTLQVLKMVVRFALLLFSQDFFLFYSLRISLRSWLQERNGRMKWGCTEGAWCSVPGAEQLWVDSPAHICMLTVLPRQKLGTFGSGSMNFQNRTGNTQLWVWPLLLFVKLSIQVSFLVSAPVPWNVLPLQMVVSKHKLKNYERALIQGLQWI